MEKLNWEQIDANHFRAKVFGGWLVKAIEDVSHNLPEQGIRNGWDWRVAMCFLPDPKYEWEVETSLITMLRDEEDTRLEKKNW